MSVLIKGMEMPQNCWQCPFHDDVDDCILLKQSCMKVWGETKRLDDCPLVEIPQHDRLIGAEALRKQMYHEAFETDSDMQKWDSGCWIRYKMFENALESAPTIIDAEESE